MVESRERTGILIDKRIIDINAAYVLYLRDVEGEVLPLKIANIKAPPKMIKFLREVRVL